MQNKGLKIISGCETSYSFEKFLHLIDLTFYKVFQMSIVNLKIISVKKQSTHANAQLKAGARHSLQQKWPFSH